MTTSQVPHAGTTTSTERPMTTSSGARGRHRVGAWVTLVLAVVVLAALLIFVGQNSRTVEIHFLGANTSLGFGVAMLLSAAAGVVLALLVGAALRVRRSVRSRS